MSIVCGLSQIVSFYFLLHLGTMGTMQRVRQPTFLCICAVFVLTVVAMLSPSTSHALSTGMNASYVYGQSNFTSALTTVSTIFLLSPTSVATTNNKVIVTDAGNQRILIYNSFPSFNQPVADLVVGQSNFSGKNPSTSGCGYNFQTTAPLLGSGTTDGTRLLVSDSGNNRVFIYNTIPTGSGVCPDVVVGQASTSVTTAGTTQAKLNKPAKAVVAGGMLFVSDYSNNRVLIYNSIPTANGASADVVVGQTGFTASTSGLLANKVNSPKSVTSNGTKLVVADTGNNRVLIFNSIPTNSGASADVVLGQASFTSSTLNGAPGAITAASVGVPEDVFLDSAGRLYMSDSSNHRVLIWNSIPTKNNQAADVVIGQNDFVSGLPSLTNESFNTPMGISFSNGYLFVADSGNNRVLAFQNLVTAPAVDSDNKVLFGKNGLLRIHGTASTGAAYNVQSVLFSVNQSSYQNATPNDGDFGNDSSEDFTIDYDPKSGIPTGDGYTLRIQSQNNNNDISNGFLYFQPFRADEPANNTYSEDPLPTFAFTVNGQRTVLRDNLSSYAIMIREPGGDWQSYIQNIPVDFASVSTKTDNLRSREYANTQVNNGVYETKDFTAIYSRESSHIQVRAKDPTQTSFDSGGKTLGGVIEWRVEATDQGGHVQDTDTFVVRLASHQVLKNSLIFPLAILNISGVGDPHLNSYNQDIASTSLRSSSKAPIFYGIASIGAHISLDIKDTQCVAQAGCTKSYTTTANGQSRFGINIPTGDMLSEHTYSAFIRAEQNGNYVELPSFLLTISP